MPAGPAPYNMKNLLLFQNFGIWEVLIIAFVVLLLFGGKKIPELMKGLGKGVKSFKEGMKDVEKEIKDIDNEVKSEE
jgi:sec-independent protein translocase protein TatA